MDSVTLFTPLPPPPFDWDRVYCRVLEKQADRDTLRSLAGPAFEDPTRLAHSEDPLSYELFWEEEDGGRVLGEVSPFWIFSWLEDGRLYGVTLSTLGTILSGEFQHPIPPSDLSRAESLILYCRTFIPLCPNLVLYSEEENTLAIRITNVFETFVPDIISEVDGRWFLPLSTRSYLSIARHLGLDARGLSTRTELLQTLVQALEVLHWSGQGDVLWDALHYSSQYIPRLAELLV